MPWVAHSTWIAYWQQQQAQQAMLDQAIAEGKALPPDNPSL
jgi:hypothetical protein